MGYLSGFAASVKSWGLSLGKKVGYIPLETMLLYGSETCLDKEGHVNRLERNYSRMVI